MYKKKNILITGGSGFLGRHLAKQIDKKKFNIILCSRNNTLNRYSNFFTNCLSAPLDISNFNNVNEIFNRFKPDYVIHAAATKFVDTSITYPNECIDINVIGSQNIARSAIQNNVKSVIGISTDKATPPASTIYGLSKSIMEHLFFNLSKSSKTKFTCVRFGNIAWSSGSVLPIWESMIKKKNKITTTGFEMKRFIFSVQDASELVLRCLNNYKSLNGKIVSQDMKYVKIGNLLKVFAKEYKCKWIKGHKRPGDQINEILIGNSEINKTDIVKINNIKHYIIDYHKENYSKLNQEISTINTKEYNDLEIKKLILNKPEVVL